MAQTAPVTDQPKDQSSEPTDTPAGQPTPADQPATCPRRRHRHRQPRPPPPPPPAAPAALSRRPTHRLSWACQRRHPPPAQQKAPISGSITPHSRPARLRRVIRPPPPAIQVRLADLRLVRPQVRRAIPHLRRWVTAPHRPATKRPTSGLSGRSSARIRSSSRLLSSASGVGRWPFGDRRSPDRRAIARGGRCGRGVCAEARALRADSNRNSHSRTHANDNTQDCFRHAPANRRRHVATEAHRNARAVGDSRAR